MPRQTKAGWLAELTGAMAAGNERLPQKRAPSAALRADQLPLHSQQFLEQSLLNAAFSGEGAVVFGQDPPPNLRPNLGIKRWGDWGKPRYMKMESLLHPDSREPHHHACHGLFTKYSSNGITHLWQIFFCPMGERGVFLMQMCMLALICKTSMHINRRRQLKQIPVRTCPFPIFRMTSLLTTEHPTTCYPL